MENGFDQAKVERYNSVKELEKRVQMEAGGKKEVTVIIPLGPKGMGTTLVGEKSLKTFFQGKKYSVISFEKIRK